MIRSASKESERLVCAEAPEAVLRALRTALAGGPPVAPLSPDSVERAQALTVLRPDEPVAEADAVALITTSGSTGRPKGVVLSRRALVAATEAAHHRLGGPGGWILALPPHYVAGVMVLARAAVAGTHVAVTDPRLSGLQHAAEALTGRRYLSLVPAQLARACADPALSNVLAGLDAVLVGGAPLDPRLRKRAHDLGIPVVTTYGLSETSGGCVFDGVPLEGMTVDLDPESGRITLRGPMLFSGYRMDALSTAACLRGSTFTTQDRGRWVDGRLEVIGRLDAVVVSGGRNIDLDELEQLAQAGVDADIAIVGLPDPDWGTEVVAVGTGPETLTELHDRLAGEVPAYALPRRLIRVADLPRTGGGKVDRTRLIQYLARSPKDTA